MALGLPASKVVYGIMPGHADAGKETDLVVTVLLPASEYVSVEDAKAIADYALEKGLGGVMTWDVNRDCT